MPKIMRMKLGVKIQANDWIAPGECLAKVWHGLEHKNVVNSFLQFQNNTANCDNLWQMTAKGMANIWQKKVTLHTQRRTPDIH